MMRGKWLHTFHRRIRTSFGLVQPLPRPQNFLHIQRTLRPPWTTARFFPAGVPDKGQKTRCRWFRGGPRSSFFDRRSAWNSAILLRGVSTSPPRFPLSFSPLSPPFPPTPLSSPRSRRDPSRGRLRRRTPVLFILWIPNTRRRAALYYNLLTDVIITILYKWPVAGRAKARVYLLPQLPASA